MSLFLWVAPVCPVIVSPCKNPHGPGPYIPIFTSLASRWRQPALQLHPRSNFRWGSRCLCVAGVCEHFLPCNEVLCIVDVHDHTLLIPRLAMRFCVAGSWTYTTTPSSFPTAGAEPCFEPPHFQALGRDFWPGHCPWQRDVLLSPSQLEGEFDNEESTT